MLEKETFNNLIWEPSCGEGHLSKVLEDHGYEVISTDLIDRGYGKGGVDFLEVKLDEKFKGDIITNPPYKLCKSFVEKALDIIDDGYRVAMFLKLTFMESKDRRTLFDTQPPETIWVSTSRLQCAKNGDFSTYKNGTGTAVAYAWYIWQKGNKNPPVVRWFN